MRTWLLVAAVIALTRNAYSEPRFVCDMATPSPASLCADHYAGYPTLIQSCIQEEVDSLNFLNQNQSQFTAKHCSLPKNVG
jgi:hypothetical protein